MLKFALWFCFISTVLTNKTVTESKIEVVPLLENDQNNSTTTIQQNLENSEQPVEETATGPVRFAPLPSPQEFTKCFNYSALLHIWFLLSDFVIQNIDKIEVTELEKFKNTLSYIHDYIDKTPDDYNNIEILKKDNIFRQNSNENLSDVDKIYLRSVFPVQKNKSRTKIILKYDLPGINTPSCKERFIKLIEMAHEAYLKLAKNPSCEQEGQYSNIDVNYPVDAILQNPYQEIYKKEINTFNIKTPSVPHITPLNIESIIPNYKYIQTVNNNRKPVVLSHVIHGQSIPNLYDMNPIRVSNEEKLYVTNATNIENPLPDSNNPIGDLSSKIESAKLVTDVVNPVDFDQNSNYPIEILHLPGQNNFIIKSSVENNIPKKVNLAHISPFVQLPNKQVPFQEEDNKVINLKSNPIQELLQTDAYRKPTENDNLNGNDRGEYISIDNKTPDQREDTNTPIQDNRGLYQNSFVHFNNQPNQQTINNVKPTVQTEKLVHVVNYPYRQNTNDNHNVNPYDQGYNVLSGQETYANPSNLYNNIEETPNPNLVNLESYNYDQYINYGSLSTNKLDDSQQSPSASNIHKLNTAKNKPAMIELTYLLKRPTPLVYQPFYYVKYQLPYNTFVYLKDLLKESYVRSDPMKLHQELVSKSRLVDVSPDLKSYPEEDILRLVFNNGALVKAIIINDNETFTYPVMKNLPIVESKPESRNIFKFYPHRDNMGFIIPNSKQLPVTNNSTVPNVNILKLAAATGFPRPMKAPVDRKVVLPTLFSSVPYHSYGLSQRPVVNPENNKFGVVPRTYSYNRMVSNVNPMAIINQRSGLNPGLNFTTLPYYLGQVPI